MPRRTDPTRLKFAKVGGATTAVRDRIRLADPAEIGRQREALPALWERTDHLTDMIDRAKDMDSGSQALARSSTLSE